MSILATTHPTLLDVTKRMDPDGKIDRIAELLNLTNEVLDDAVYIEGNLPTGHRSTIRTGLPTPTWRKLYGGVQPTKSNTVQVTDSIGMLEDYAEVDKRAADLNGNTAEFRLSEDAAHIEGMSQQLATTIFYGNETTNPAAFTGLAPRFNSKTALNGKNVIDDGSPSGNNNTSIWLVVWGPNTCHMVYPKGSQAGLRMEDKGQVTIENLNGDGGRMEAYRTHYAMDAGMVVRDWRYVVRISVNTSTLTKDASSGDDIIDLMTQAVEMIPSLGMGRPAFYMNRNIRSYLRRQISNKTKQSTLKTETIAGKIVTSFDEIPCRRVDALTNNEAAI